MECIENPGKPKIYVNNIFNSLHVLEEVWFTEFWIEGTKECMCYNIAP